MSELMKNEAFLKSRDEEIAKLREALTRNFNETMDKTEEIIKSLEVNPQDVHMFGDHIGAIMVGNAIGQSVSGVRKFVEVLREESNYVPERALRILITLGYVEKVLAVVNSDINILNDAVSHGKEKIKALEEELKAKKEKEQA